MKKVKGIINLIVLVALIMLSTGCINKKALTPEKFKEKMEERKFVVGDATDQFTTKNYIKKMYVAQNKDLTYQIEYYSMTSETKAKDFYESKKTMFEKVSNTSNSTISKGNNSKYSQTGGGKYSVVSRIDNTVIILDVAKEYKEEINEILKDLDY